MVTGQEIIDIHSHVLPGIDDGAKSWDMSMQMLKSAWDSGVRHVVATPHFLPWEPQVPPEEIRKMCREAAQRFSDLYGLEMILCPGEELYYHSGLLDDLQAGRALTLNDTDCILVEFGTMMPGQEIMKAVQHLKRSGFQVILAHYERYKALAQKDLAGELVDLGVMLQSNVEAIAGGCFDQEARRVRKDYKRGLISFSGSDMHNLTSRPPISRKDLRNLAACLDEGQMRKVLYDHAAALLL